MKVEKFKVLLYLKKSGLDKNGKAPIMGRITSTEQWRSSVASCHVRQSYGIHVRADLTARARRLWK